MKHTLTEIRNLRNQGYSLEERRDIIKRREKIEDTIGNIGLTSFNLGLLSLPFAVYHPEIVGISSAMMTIGTGLAHFEKEIRRLYESSFSSGDDNSLIEGDNPYRLQHMEVQ